MSTILRITISLGLAAFLAACSNSDNSDSLPATAVPTATEASAPAPDPTATTPPEPDPTATALPAVALEPWTQELCALIGDDDLEAALGAPVADREIRGSPTAFDCVYHAANGWGIDFAAATVSEVDRSLSGGALYVAVMDRLEAIGYQFTRHDFIGNGAVQLTNGRGGDHVGQIWVISGTDIRRIRAFGDVPDGLDVATQLMLFVESISEPLDQ